MSPRSAAPQPAEMVTPPAPREGREGSAVAWLASRRLEGPAATDRLGAALAPVLGPGDVLLLEGAVGAGKTHLARALIGALLPEPEEIPSPSYTLVQTYPGPGFEIWHADLYRLSGPDEVGELGLEAAFETALCLVEWPDRLGPLAPAEALRLRLTDVDDGAARELMIGAASRQAAEGWRARLGEVLGP